MRTRTKRPTPASRSKPKPTKKRRNVDPIDLPGDTPTITGVNVRKVQETIDATGNLYWKPPEGTTTLRILPPTAAYEGDFAVRQVLHFGFEDENGRTRTVRCLTDVGEDCPVCAFVEYLMGTGEEDDKKLARDMRKQTQLMTEIIIRPSKRVRIWKMPVTIYRNLAGLLAEPRVGDFTDPKNGRDIALIRKGQMLHTRYQVSTLDRESIGFTSWKRNRVNLEGQLAPKVSEAKLVKLLRKHYKWDYT